MKTFNATEAKHRFGDVMLNLSQPDDGVLIEKNGKPYAMAFQAEVAKQLVLSGYSLGVISRGTAMSMLGLTWYGELLDLLSAAKIKRPTLIKGERNVLSNIALHALGD